MRPNESSDASEDLADAVETIGVILPSFMLGFITVTLSTIIFDRRQFAQRFVYEFFLITLPILLITTVLSDYTTLVNIVLFTIAFPLFLTTKGYIRSLGNDKVLSTESEKKSFITNARSTINIITAVAILATHFRIFPPNFRKTHKYGFSLMDVGVGLFVYANGIVAPETRGIKHPVYKTFLNVLPLFVIGVIRFVLIKRLDYYVNVLEYGVHWNFFITLGITKLLSAIIMSLTRTNIYTCTAQGIILIVIHQASLYYGLEEYVFSSVPRDTFINANREGIISSLGYVALYFLSVSLGFLMQKSHNLLKNLLTTTIVLGTLTIILYITFNISRCIANSTYCAWILFIGLSMTLLFHAIETVFKSDSTSVIQVPFVYETINFNGLTYFVVANLLTGLVNLIFDTENVSSYNSLVILSIYMILTTLSVSILYVYNIRLKL